MFRETRVMVTVEQVEHPLDLHLTRLPLSQQPERLAGRWDCLMLVEKVRKEGVLLLTMVAVVLVGRMAGMVLDGALAVLAVGKNYLPLVETALLGLFI